MGTPTHDELCQAAYRFWEERGCPDGSPEVDWQRAEYELGGPAGVEASAAGSAPNATDGRP
jgi:Protein of unknown function (DUF2934)